MTPIRINGKLESNRELKSPQFEVVFDFKNIPTYSGIYYIGDRGLVRIGRSENVRARFKSHLSSNLGIKYICSEVCDKENLVYLESKRHNQFREYRMYGEWFASHKELEKHIKKILKKQRLNKEINNPDYTTDYGPDWNLCDIYNDNYR